MPNNDTEVYRAVTTAWGVKEPHDEPWHEEALFHSGEEVKLMEENAALRQRLAILDAHLLTEKKKATRESHQIATLRRAISDFAHLYFTEFTEDDLRSRVRGLEKQLSDLKASVSGLIESEQRAARAEAVFEEELRFLGAKVSRGEATPPVEPDDFDYTAALEENP